MKHQITEDSIYWVEGVRKEDQPLVDALRWEGKRDTMLCMYAWIDVLRLLSRYDEYATRNNLHEYPFWKMVRGQNCYVSVSLYKVTVFLAGLNSVRGYEVEREYPYRGLGSVLEAMHSHMSAIDDGYCQSSDYLDVCATREWLCTHPWHM